MISTAGVIDIASTLQSQGSSVYINPSYGSLDGSTALPPVRIAPTTYGSVLNPSSSLMDCMKRITHSSEEPSTCSDVNIYTKHSNGTFQFDISVNPSGLTPQKLTSDTHDLVLATVDGGAASDMLFRAKPGMLPVEPTIVLAYRQRSDQAVMYHFGSTEPVAKL